MNLAVEGWRGLAALLVLVSHWLPAVGLRNPWIEFCFTGVDVFFVLSGFVFAPQCLGSERPPLAGFVLRRVMRIYPGYLVALAVYVALTAWEGRPLLYLAEHLLMAHVQNREMAFYYSAPFWSLPSELEFYAAVPLMGWVLSRVNGRWLWWVMLAVAAGLRLGLVATADGTAQNAAYVGLHHLPGLAVEFLLGVWAWRAHRAAWSARRRWAWVAAGVGMCLACGLAFEAAQTGAQGPDWRHGQLGLGVAAGFAMVLAATAGWNRWGSGTEASPVGGGLCDNGWYGKVYPRCCAWAGRLSYGTYLLHTAFVGVLAPWAARWGALPALLMAAAGLLACVCLLHLAVEEPLRRWGRRTAARWG